jgi:hypothetical protein
VDAFSLMIFRCRAAFASFGSAALFSLRETGPCLFPSAADHLSHPFLFRRRSSFACG